MPFITDLRFAIALIFFGLCTWSKEVEGSDSISFVRDVRPILSDTCFACHGPDGETREAGLRLDLAEPAMDSGMIEPGAPEHSEIWNRITSDDPDSVMPPSDFHRQLTTEEKKTLRRWIEDGAKYEQHWSFVAPKRPRVPDSDADHPIDAFLRKRASSSGLEPSPTADRRTLIRRVTLDLTGLPPTRTEVDAFLADDSDGAYERWIERLMSRVTYGEHMARYWLDLARYADTHGLHLDNERSMWPYRDWVVRAFHQNLPFDEFTRWQLAGDLLDDPTQDQLIASGFNRCNVTTSEGGSINEEWVFRYAVDRTTTAVEVWMGMTAGCAVCHDHKFDPISAKDFYSMYAFFHSAADPAMDGNKIDTPPILKLYSVDDEKQIGRVEARLGELAANTRQRLEKYEYVDPAEQVVEPEEIETIWFEDDFPAGAEVQSSGGPLTLVDQQAGPVYSGERALRGEGVRVTQDFYNKGAKSLIVPAGGKVFVHCFLDPKKTPEAIMIQFHTNGWKHRAVWGDESKIGFGKAGTSEKVLMGDLPEAGRWVRLEVDAKRMGLSAKTQITGFAFTQFGGAVTWDHLGIQAVIDRAKDLNWSWSVWKSKKAGKRNNELPEGLRQLVRGKQPDKWNEQETKRVFNHWLEHVYAGSQELLSDLKSERAELEREKAEIEKDTPITFVMADLPQPRESFVMLRGAYDKPDEKVRRDVPGFLPGLPPKPDDRDYNRLDFSNWLVSGEHPLTARVVVNRFWQQFFGTGIVRTSGDFGSQGEPPTHPELLDWLAVEFVESGWNVNALVKQMLTSDAYRQQSKMTEAGLRLDPDNRLLARGPRLRLDAEVLRDQALFVGGLLVAKVGGKGVKPYQPPNIWEPVGFGNSNTRYYKQDNGEDLYRRSLYTFLKRTAPPPFMSSFDAPNREQSCTRRGRSNTPMQALQLMNDVQHVEAARQFATRMIREGGENATARFRWAFETLLARGPTELEMSVMQEALNGFRMRYAKNSEAAKELISYGESAPFDSIAPEELAAYTMIGNLILNLDETVTKN